MNTKVEQEFKAWKRKNGYKSMNEGFLDDDEDKAPVDSLTIGDTEEDKPSAEDEADLIGSETQKADTDGGDIPTEEVEEKDGSSATEGTAEVLASIKDMLSNLNTTMQTMTDTLSKQKEEPEEETSDSAEDEFADIDLGDEGSDEANDSGDDEEGDMDSNEDEDTSDVSDEEAAEGDDSSDEPESDDSENDNEGSEEEYSGEDEKDETKSESYNMNMKRGGVLNSNSNTLVGILESGKYWKLEDGLDTLISLKLKERVEKAKSKFRQKMLEELLEED